MTTPTTAPPAGTDEVEVPDDLWSLVDSYAIDRHISALHFNDKDALDRHVRSRRALRTELAALVARMAAAERVVEAATAWREARRGIYGNLEKLTANADVRFELGRSLDAAVDAYRTTQAPDPGADGGEEAK